jgi:acetyl-CoA synthetase (ADP-forming)
MSDKTNEIINNALKEGRVNLLEPEAKAICAQYGITTPEFDVASNAEDAVESAKKIGYPVVMKIVSQDILHKTDAGGVKVGLENDAEVKSGFEEILQNAKKYKKDANIIGVLVQKMAPSSTEVIVGALKDPQFGQTLMFGIGGIFVEVLKDVTFRIAPIVEKDAKEMIGEIKAYPILKGYRNTPPADEGAIVNILLNVSKLIMEHPEINQMDLNPIMVYENGASVVDARIILEKP